MIRCPDCGGTINGRLLDAAAIMHELGVTRAAADAIMRRLPKTEVPGLRKVYVQRADLERLLRESQKAA